jgi:type I restriction enzyme R subunit
VTTFPQRIKSAPPSEEYRSSAPSPYQIDWHRIPVRPRDVEVDLEYYRLQRIYSGEIALKEGEPEGVKSPTEVGTGKAKDEKVPLSEIIQILNDRFATSFTEEDRLFFEQIREKASKNPRVIQTALANPLDKFQLGIRKLIEEFMVQRMSEDDKIVARYRDDQEFQNTAFPILAKAIFETVPGKTE